MHWLGKDIESFKTELKIANLEYEHSVIALQTKRADIVATLYDHLISFIKSSESYASQFEFSGEPSKEEKGKDFAEKADAFLDYFVRNRIYFPKKICDDIDLLWNEILKPMRSYSFWRVRDEYSERTSVAWDKASDVMSKKVPAILGAIEDEFRSILGVQRKI